MISSDCTIITIGDELLIGQVIDTNSAWMAQELNNIGMSVGRRIAVGDVWEDIWQALDISLQASKLVLITGGLGPTSDDITKPLLSAYFGGKMVVDEGALANVQRIFERISRDLPGGPRPMLERNLKQAEVPEGCTVLQNPVGTAPGMLFRKDGAVVVSMPGVPHEMKRMMTDTVLPLVQRELVSGAVAHCTLLTAGQGESYLAERLIPFEAQLPSHCKLAYLPSYGMVRLRLTVRLPEAAAAKALVESQFGLLKSSVADLLVTDHDEPLHEVVMRLLKERGQTLSLAESCTGGYMAHLVTRVPGSSAVFNGSAVVYQNAAKSKLVGVKEETLMEHGAVSEQVVEQMAQGAREVFGTDVAIAVSGIMGPDGGSEAKPVGTVWMAAASADKVVSRMVRFRFDRMRNIELTANYAFNLLRQLMTGAQ